MDLKVSNSVSSALMGKKRAQRLAQKERKRLERNAGRLKFFVHSTGERGAGILPFHDVVEMSFLYTPKELIDTDFVEFFRDALKDFYDGASVETEFEVRGERDTRKKTVG